ncbi:sensor histidine kinase [Chitinophaga sp. 30R24]|uniref:sensor histidine kinase n=1 Tax=Chitinophaga sp. 30R24 TaxID=3248838 RepID=UPI003B8EDC0A
MRKAINVLLICVLIGSSFGVYLYFTYDHRPVRILMSLLSNVNIGALMMLTIYSRRFFTASIHSPGIRIGVMISALILAALAGTELTTFMLSLLPATPPYRLLHGTDIYALNILIVLIIGIPIYVSEEWKSMLGNQLLQQQYRILQLEQQQTAFELALLRAKINPHFLYNVHNAIAGLIPLDPGKAEQLVLLLSKFFRFTLKNDSATFHAIADELDIVRTYLQMQQIRYDSRMQYTITADPSTLSLSIPSFILQPLVENAVKHGIEAITGNGSIEVRIMLQEENILITIADPGPAFPDKPGNGLGLHLVISKLQLLYTSDFNIEFNNTSHKYVQLTLPKRN